ncbi:MAG: bifunctional adenosylcobinamide kinase/adenosylcobinamide-phosphate guanylyltransferase [Clostridiales bacterium]|nr:bifunctional adenosylcobinamide kinase/adenosylcobinamide-phosphate guanylyltransferase [Clostridiales bacterium]
MLHLITGGSASGKSEYAESRVVESGQRERYYIACMRPYGEEGRERVRKHRAMREGKGFITIECYDHLSSLRFAGERTGRAILLECMSNLTANEQFGAGGTDEEIINRIVKGAASLCSQAENVWIVTNEVFSDGVQYDAETMRYLRLLGMVNQKLAEIADHITEVVYGIAVTIR